MISERRLTGDFSSLWRTLLPLSESFTRRVNAQLKRFARPLPSSRSAESSALVSELGFRYFAALLQGRLQASGATLEPDSVREEIDAEVAAYIASLPSYHGTSALPDVGERHEAGELANRLKLFIALEEGSKSIELSPLFRGCGILDDCRGDILIGQTLYEVKNVGRDFRSLDLRQLLIYSTLAAATGTSTIAEVGLLNARQGTFIRLTLDQMSFGMAGVDATELLSQIIYYLSTEQLSS